MKKTITNHISIIGLFIALVAIAFFVFGSSNTDTVQASVPDHNVFGAAWGASDGEGIGWVSMNNCLTPTNCPGVGFGVNIDETTGDLSGAGWSSNYGWVNFGSNVCGQQPNVNLQDVIDDSEAYVTGFAHVHNAVDDGFWDGCIKMSDTVPQPYGVKLYDTGDIDGAAWGAEVVGWLDFEGVETSIVFGCTDSDAVNYDSDATVDDDSCKITVPPNTSHCVNPPWNQTIIIPDDLSDYNTALPLGDPILVHDPLTDKCQLKGDFCPWQLAPNYDYENNMADAEAMLNAGSGEVYKDSDDFCLRKTAVCTTNSSASNYFDPSNLSPNQMPGGPCITGQTPGGIVIPRINEI